MRQSDVAYGGHARHETLRLAILRQETDAGTDRVVRAPKKDGRAVDFDPPGVGAVSPGEDPCQFGSACAHQPGDAEDLAGSQGKTDILDRSRPADALGAQQQGGQVHLHLSADSSAEG